MGRIDRAFRLIGLVLIVALGALWGAYLYFLVWHGHAIFGPIVVLITGLNTFTIVVLLINSTKQREIAEQIGRMRERL